MNAALGLESLDYGTRVLRASAFLGLLALAGAVSVVEPLAGAVVILLTYLLVRNRGVFRDALVVLLVGNVTLTYGFANVGLRLGGIPVPLTEILLLPVAAFALLRLRSLSGLGPPATLLVGLLTLASVRLVVDVPRWGNLALRDFTTPLEAIALVVGFWAVREYGVRWCARLCLGAALAVLAYGALFPLRDSIATLGPTVGLQQAVPLLGQYSGAAPAVAAALFLFLLRFRAPWSPILGAASLAVIALLQSRGLYLAIPLAGLSVLLVAGNFGGAFPARLAGSVVLGGFMLLLLVPLGPQGRMGPVSAGFASSQIVTLLGRDGPGAGSFDHRVHWAQELWSRQNQAVGSVIWGVGMGPDLADGAAGGQEFIRKPHNDYLEVFARFGVLGLGLWLGLVGASLNAVRRGIKAATDPESKTFLVWILAASLVYLFVAATQPLLAFPYGTMPLFLMLGMGLALARGEGTSQ